MEKIIVNPLEVRGLGNIVSPKTLEDFEVYNSSLSFEDNVYTLEYSPGTVSVALTVSSGSITIGESIVLEAIVTDDGVPLENVSVRFVTGNQVLGTDDTDVNGEASLTVSDLSVGSYSIYASANGQSSSPVSVTVSKLTSTITLSVPSTGTVGTSYTVSGTLVPSSGSVKLYENSVLKDTLTVSNGSFSKAITQNSEGTYSYYAVFEGSSTYSSVTSSTGSIVVSDVPTPVVTSVSLSADKSILSYADSESATLSATVLDSNDDPMSGVTVEFFKGSTSLGTADTNSSGIATKTYASAGSGDVSFTASVGTISSEIYEVEDCFRYDDASVDNTSKYSYNNLNSLTFVTDHYEAVRTSTSNFYSPIYVDETLPTNFEMKVDINATFTGNSHQEMLTFGANHPNTYSGTSEIGIVSSGARYGLFKRISGTFTSYATNGTISANVWYTFIVKRNGTSVTAKILNNQGTEIHNATQTISEAPNYNKWNLIVGDSAYTLKWKNLKIKPL